MFTSSEVAHRIKSHAKSKGVAVKNLLEACDLNKNTLSNMQSGGFFPRAETIVRIADYLDCSVDYLLGRTDVPEINRGRPPDDGQP